MKKSKKGPDLNLNLFETQFKAIRETKATTLHLSCDGNARAEI